MPMCAMIPPPRVRMSSCLPASYEKLNSGSVAESLVELSGGVSQKILLTEDASKAAAKDGSLWRRLARCVSVPCFVPVALFSPSGGLSILGACSIVVVVVVAAPFFSGIYI